MLRYFFSALFLFAFISTVLAQSGIEQNRLRSAQKLEQVGQHERALEIFKKLFDESPANIAYYEGVKRNMLRLGQYEALLSIVEERFKSTKDARYAADIGAVQYQGGNQELAMKTWQDILQANRENLLAYTFVANAMTNNRLYDEAIDVYKGARQNLADKSLFVLELAELYVFRLNYENATQEYLNHLKENPNQFNYIEGRVSAMTKDVEAANRVAEVLESFLLADRRNQEYVVRKLLADIYLRIEDYSKALVEFRRLEDIREPGSKEEKAAGKEIFFFADRSLKAGNYQYAIGGFEIILTNYPKSSYVPRAKFNIAYAKQAMGQWNESIKGFEEVISQNPGSSLAHDAAFQLGEIYLNGTFDLQKAREAYHSAIERHTRGRQRSLAHIRIGDCFTAEGDLKQAEVWYRRASASSGLTPTERSEANYKLAFNAFLSKDYEAATAILKEITANLESDSGQEFSNDALELLFLIEENKERSKEGLDIYANARFLLARNRQEDAIASLREITVNHDSSDVADKAYLQLAELMVERGEYAAAVAVLESFLEKHPDNLNTD
jgi:tetratricopeptide (TPR) repeat protein